MSRYQPLTEAQVQEMMRPPLLDEGVYPFKVLEVHNADKYHSEYTDKNGDPMTKLKLGIMYDGKERFVFTNLFWGVENKMSYRTKHFADSVGLSEAYADGSLLDNIKSALGKTGHCEIKIQEARPKNDGTKEMWARKNDVKDFVIAEQQQEKGEEFKDSDIPF